MGDWFSLHYRRRQFRSIGPQVNRVSGWEKSKSQSRNKHGSAGSLATACAVPDVSGLLWDRGGGEKSCGFVVAKHQIEILHRLPGGALT